MLTSGKITDIHKHKCKQCGHVWIHDALVLKDAQELNDTHICPSGCGNYEIDKIYDEDTDPKPTCNEENEVQKFYAELYRLNKPSTFKFFAMAVRSVIASRNRNRESIQ